MQDLQSRIQEQLEEAGDLEVGTLQEQANCRSVKAYSRLMVDGSCLGFLPAANQGQMALNTMYLELQQRAVRHAVALRKTVVEIVLRGED